MPIRNPQKFIFVVLQVEFLRKELIVER